MSRDFMSPNNYLCYRFSEQSGMILILSSNELINWSRLCVGFVFFGGGGRLNSFYTTLRFELFCDYSKLPVFILCLISSFRSPFLFISLVNAIVKFFMCNAR